MCISIYIYIHYVNTICMLIYMAVLIRTRMIHLCILGLFAYISDKPTSYYITLLPQGRAAKSQSLFSKLLPSPLQPEIERQKPWHGHLCAKNLQRYYPPGN